MRKTVFDVMADKDPPGNYELKKEIGLGDNPIWHITYRPSGETVGTFVVESWAKTVCDAMNVAGTHPLTMRQLLCVHFGLTMFVDWQFKRQGKTTQEIQNMNACRQVVQSLENYAPLQTWMALETSKIAEAKKNGKMGS